MCSSSPKIEASLSNSEALVAVFTALSPPSNPGYFAGLEFLDRPGWHICKDHSSRPAVLLPAIRTGSPGIRLESLHVVHGATCQIAAQGGTSHSGSYSVLLCVSPDPMLHALFLRTISAALAALPTSPSESQVSGVIAHVASLFQLVQQPPARSVQGLWAELFLACHAQDPAALVRAWHVDPDERFDFWSEWQAIEVKSSARTARIHHFSHSQLHPPSDYDVWIASVFVESRSGGESVLDLRNRLVSKIPDVELTQKIDHVCVSSLGRAWTDSSSRSFDLAAATESLRFVRVNEAPRLPRELPRGVLDLRLTVDLGDSEGIDVATLRRRGGLFECL